MPDPLPKLPRARTSRPAAFHNWGNSIGDPSTSTGFAMFGPSPHSVWSSDDGDALLGPLWGEPDEAERIEGCRAAGRLIAQEAYVIPLLQYVQPIVHSGRIKVTLHVANSLLPQATQPVGRRSQPEVGIVDQALAP